MSNREDRDDDLSRPPGGSEDGGGDHGWGVPPSDPARPSWGDGAQQVGGQQVGGWSSQAYGHAEDAATPDHPRATAAMVIGVLALVGGLLFGGLPLLGSPVALFVGRRAVSEIDDSQGRLGGRTRARTGLVTGAIGTALLIAGVLGVIILGGFIATGGFV